MFAQIHTATHVRRTNDVNATINVELISIVSVCRPIDLRLVGPSTKRSLAKRLDLGLELKSIIAVVIKIKGYICYPFPIHVSVFNEWAGTWAGCDYSGSLQLLWLKCSFYYNNLRHKFVSAYA